MVEQAVLGPRRSLHRNHLAVGCNQIAQQGADLVGGKPQGGQSLLAQNAQPLPGFGKAGGK